MLLMIAQRMGKNRTYENRLCANSIDWDIAVIHEILNHCPTLAVYAARPQQRDLESSIRIALTNSTRSTIRDVYIPRTTFSPPSQAAYHRATTLLMVKEYQLLNMMEEEC